MCYLVYHHYRQEVYYLAFLANLDLVYHHYHPAIHYLADLDVLAAK
jgi:hypothetical protein